MRSFQFLRAAALLLPSLTTAIGLPVPPSEFSKTDFKQPKDILSVTGRSGDQEVSIRFQTPCQGCFIGTDDGLIFDLSVERAESECGNIVPRLNGLPLVRQWEESVGNGYGHGYGVFKTQLANGLGERDIYASYEAVCVKDQAQIVSFTVHTVGQAKVQETSGFTASFKQQGHPEVLRLKGEPTKLDPQDNGLLESWLQPSTSQRLSTVQPEQKDSLEEALAKHLNELKELKAKASGLDRLIHEKERQIDFLIKQDVRSLRSAIKACSGLKCMFQTTIQRAPKIAKEISDRLGRRPLTEHTFGGHAQKTGHHWAKLPNETRSLDEDRGGPMVDLFEVSPIPAPQSPDMPQPPTLPADFDHPRHDMPPPPPEHDMPPPPPYHFRPGSPSGHHGPNGHHGPPPGFFPHSHRHHHHHRPHLIKAVVLIIILIALSSFAFRFLRRHTSLFTNPHRAADRACRREERRNRRAHRRAAAHHRFSQWWSRYRKPRSNEDYDEKRTLILEQEGVLEAAMQDELRTLRSAQEIVEGIYSAEEGRSRLYRQANRPARGPAAVVELDAGSSSSNSGNVLPLYSLPPPRYEEEIEGDMTVVDGFQYTPTSTDDTPDSSVIDCSPRMSFDTGRTLVTTRGGDQD